jgi:hypothetical protein
MKRTTKFEVEAAALVEALKVRASTVGTVRKGTYNQQDPTAFEKVRCFLYFQMDQYYLKDYKHTPTEAELKECPQEMFDHAPPPDALYELQVDDVTWGTEVSLTFFNSSISNEAMWRISADARVLHFYLDHQSGEICWEKDLDKVRDFLLFCLCGDCEFLEEPRKFEKDMTEEELRVVELNRELEAWDASMRRSCV